MALLDEVVVTAKRPTHTFNGCVEGARYMSDMLLGQPGATANLYNVRGNAWELPYSSFGQVYNAGDVKDYKLNDLVVFDRPELPSDKSKKIPSTMQHVGVVTGFAEDGTPMISHYTTPNAPLNYDPINEVVLKKGDEVITKYTPDKVIRLNISQSPKTPNYSNFTLSENDDYGVNLNEAIKSLQDFDTKKLGLSANEVKDLQLATLGIMGLESDFGGGYRFMVRNQFPDIVNTVKQIKRGKWEVPSIGYGSLKPEYVYVNTTYPDLDEQLKSGKITKKQYYDETQQRTARASQIYNFSKPLSLAYSLGEAYNYSPQTTLSYTGNLLGYAGLDKRDVGENIGIDSKLIFTQLAGLRKKYPNLSAKDLVAMYRGRKFYDEDSRKYDQITNQIKQGEYNPGFSNRLLQRISNTTDAVKGFINQAKNEVIKEFTPGANWKAIATDVNNADDIIDNSYLSPEEQYALGTIVARAINNGKNLLGYTSDNNYEAYVPTDGMAGSGGAKGVWQSVQSVASNIFDPRTRLQNLLGQARITEDENNYYVEDEYDFNNAGQAQNPFQSIVKAPTPYNVVRSFGTAHGAAPGGGRKVRIVIPKSEVKKRPKLISKPKK